MNKSILYPLLLLTLFIVSIWYVFYDFSPRYYTDFNAKADQFSTDRAYEHVKKIAEYTHYVGTKAHSDTRNYLIDQLEKLGLKVHTQSGYILNKYGEFTIPENIIAKIEGKNPEARALVLLSHYDSSPHSSYGASDAGSGVAAILEAVRAFQAKNIKPEMDVIICFSDAEELGLLGAKLFVNKHEWAKNLGLVLNFEARGSGGPSNMIVETNHGNKALIKSFAAAGVDNPLGTSLMYSVYKLLPNDTDSTVFREDADVPSFFFAFIDDHFDYHTALDKPERLDKESLTHQGDYALNLLEYFSRVSLDDMFVSDQDMVYFDLPEFGMFYYPFSWIWPMYFVFLIAFFSILFYGFKKKALSKKEIFKGFLPYLLGIVFSFALGYFGWQIILSIYPHYKEILQGFPYNGHNYIFAFTCFSLSFCLAIYSWFQRKLNPHNAMVAPIVLWFILCAVINIYLEGAAYFTLVLGFSVVVFALCTFREVPNMFLVWFMYLPAIGLIIPLIQFFPVGLGLEMIVISTVLTALLFGLMIGFIGYLPFKGRLSVVFLLLAVAFIIVSHIGSGFSKNQPKPNSLVYIADQVLEKAYWNTYDNQLDAWNKDFFKDTISLKNTSLQSKYSTSFAYSSEAKYYNFKASDFDIKIDSLDNYRLKVEFNIYPEEGVKRIEFYTKKDYNFEEFTVGGEKADSIKTKNNTYHIFKKRYSSRLLTYHVVNREELKIEFIAKQPIPEFQLFETRFDLLDNKNLGVPKRQPDMIPKPFVVNDAIIVKQSILFK